MSIETLAQKDPFAEKFAHPTGSGETSDTHDTHMKISFVIPAYNEEATIGACVASIRAEIERAHADAEIIVVNNASTDRTHERAAAYPYVRVIDEPRKGTNRARQTGFEASIGELVGNIDADSVMPASWLDTVLPAFERDKKLAALGGPYIYHDLSLSGRAMTQFFQFWMFVAYLFNRFVLRSGSQLLGGNCVIRREALQQIGGYDTSLIFFGDDIDTAKRLMRAGKVKFTYRLPIYSSGRRYSKEGFLKAAWMYLLNFFTQMYGARAYSTAHADPRQEENVTAH